MSDFFLNHIEWLRAFHICFVIFWMAGLLYLPRLFVYHSKAVPRGELDETLKIQELKLMRIIMNPAMIIAFILGMILIFAQVELMKTSIWLHIKLVFVFLLMGYHGFLSKMRKKFAAGERPKSEKFFRLINEIPAIFTIIIVILAVVKPF